MLINYFFYFVQSCILWNLNNIVYVITKLNIWIYTQCHLSGGYFFIKFTTFHHLNLLSTAKEYEKFCIWKSIIVTDNAQNSSNSCGNYTSRLDGMNNHVKAIHKYDFFFVHCDFITALQVLKIKVRTLN